jgi:hypothetical protein
MGAHPDETWGKLIQDQPEKKYLNWLSDEVMLPSVVPKCRIMRYGYESEWFGANSIAVRMDTIANRLLDSLSLIRQVSCICLAFIISISEAVVQHCSQRPLIFIAHCFGGLVVMKVWSPFLMNLKGGSQESGLG